MSRRSTTLKKATIDLTKDSDSDSSGDSDDSSYNPNDPQNFFYPSDSTSGSNDDQYYNKIQTYDSDSFDAEDLVCKLVQKCMLRGSFNWDLLGDESSKCFRAAPVNVTFMHGWVNTNGLPPSTKEEQRPEQEQEQPPNVETEDMHQHPIEELPTNNTSLLQDAALPPEPPKQQPTHHQHVNANPLHEIDSQFSRLCSEPWKATIAFPMDKSAMGDVQTVNLCDYFNKRTRAAAGYIRKPSPPEAHKQTRLYFPPSQEHK